VDTRFLAVLLPRILGREAWDFQGARPDGFRYREMAPGAQTRVWMNPAYALGVSAIRAFALNGWPAEIRGAMVAPEPRGGVVDGLPAERYSVDPPGPPPRPPTEVALTDDQDRQCVEAGLVPLVGLEGLPEAAFAAMPSLHRPPRMDRDEANANQRLSSQFNAMLCVSRFAHCVKVMGRDMVGSQQGATDIQHRLSEWLMKYTNSAAPAGGDTGARYPLRGSNVEVQEKPGQPGVYGCTIHLQPHYQLDEVGASFRLVTDLEAARAVA
jgi:type VI secretion system protein ImpD/type VI secretion system protein ImpC